MLCLPMEERGSMCQEEFKKALVNKQGPSLPEWYSLPRPPGFLSFFQSRC